MSNNDSRNREITPSLYRHAISGRVKTFEVDRQNIVHNVIYMYWLEHARVEYVRSIGIIIEPTIFIDHHTFVVAKTEVQYLAPALFDQEYTIFTRISSIGNTSFVFDQFVQSAKDSTIYITAQSVLVQLNPQTKEPLHISKEFRDRVANYEIHSQVNGV